MNIQRRNSPSVTTSSPQSIWRRDHLADRFVLGLTERGGILRAFLVQHGGVTLVVEGRHGSL